MKQIIFICRTCQYKNRLETGDHGYEQRQVRFESVTDAYNHLIESVLSNIHDMIAVLDEDE